MKKTHAGYYTPASWCENLLAMLERLNGWTRRVHSLRVAKVPLGVGTEYWDLDPKHYEGWQELSDRRAALGRRSTKRTLAYDLASHLLNDVIVAAGGVERAIIKLRGSVDVLERHVEDHHIKGKGDVPFVVSDYGSVEAWYAFSDVLAWSRTVVERLERPPRDRKNFLKQGLIPALRPARLRKRCENLLNELQEGPVGKSRPLANFALHGALVRDPFSGVEVDALGTIALPIPDSCPASHWYLLTWGQDRNGFIFAEELWQAIQQSIDKILDAFEKSVPKRLRQNALSD